MESPNNTSGRSPEEHHSVKEFFSANELDQLKDAIRQAELRTSGEIRLHLEWGTGGEEVLDRAAEVFAQLELHKTADRNGVLFYLATGERRFAILGDTGINQVVALTFWDDIKMHIQHKFRNGKFYEGLREGIIEAGMALSRNFPYQKNDINELSDDISFG